MTREKDFKNICNSLSKDIEISTTKAILAKGDSLALIKQLPDQSVSLILTDPPYHTTKKDNIFGDTSFEKDEHYLDWMREYIKEWRRILKPNGSLYCFCSSTIAARLESIFSEYFNVLSQIVWTKPNEPGFDGWKQKMKKESLRQWYNHSERIIFVETSHPGNLHKSFFGNYLREMRNKSELTAHQLTEIIGAYGKVNHGGAVSNWEAGRNVPSEDQYQKICSALIKTGKIKEMLDYRDVIRPFNVDGTKEFTDIWTFPSVKPYKGKHPAEKPLSLLEHAIAATTYENDIVLDCFAGSGSTAIAALRLNRRSISMEIDSKWIESIKLQLNSFKNNKEYFMKIDNNKPTLKIKTGLQDTLFSELRIRSQHSVEEPDASTVRCR